MCSRKAAANIRTRSIQVNTEKILSFAVELSSVLRRSCSAALAERRWAFIRVTSRSRCGRARGDSLGGSEGFAFLRVDPGVYRTAACRQHLGCVVRGRVAHDFDRSKNAMVKQYAKLMAMDGVGLTFTRMPLRALAVEAVRKGTARAARVARAHHAGCDVRFARS